MFGKLVNLVTTPVRAVVAPVKFAADVLDPKEKEGVGDAVRYTLTGKQRARNNPTKGFCDFEDDK